MGKRGHTIQSKVSAFPRTINQGGFAFLTQKKASNHVLYNELRHYSKVKELHFFFFFC